MPGINTLYDMRDSQTEAYAAGDTELAEELGKDMYPLFNELSKTGAVWLAIKNFMHQKGVRKHSYNHKCTYVQVPVGQLILHVKRLSGGRAGQEYLDEICRKKERGLTRHVELPTDVYAIKLPI